MNLAIILLRLCFKNNFFLVIVAQFKWQLNIWRRGKRLQISNLRWRQTGMVPQSIMGNLYNCNRQFSSNKCVLLVHGASRAGHKRSNNYISHFQLSFYAIGHSAFSYSRATAPCDIFPRIPCRICVIYGHLLGGWWEERTRSKVHLRCPWLPEKAWGSCIHCLSIDPYLSTCIAFGFLCSCKGTSLVGDQNKRNLVKEQSKFRVKAEVKLAVKIDTTNF